MAWQELINRRGRFARHYRDGDSFAMQQVAGTALGYSNGEGFLSLDMRPQRLIAGDYDGWRVTKSDWHFFLGSIGGDDGWVGFGAGGGRHYLFFKLAHVAYLHWPSRDWDLIDTAVYNRGSLSQETETVTLLDGTEVHHQNNVTWDNVMPALDLRWLAAGRGLKEEIVLAPAAYPVLTGSQKPEGWADTDTYFAFIFEIDSEGVPIWAVDGLPRAFKDGFTDEDAPIELRDDLAGLLAFMPLDYAYPEPIQEAPLPLRVPLRKLLLEKNGKHYLIVGARLDKLQALPPDRSIIFDPTLVTQPDETASKDTYLDKQNSLTNYATANKLYINTTAGSGGGGTGGTGLIQFDASSIPSYAQCSSAVLDLYTIYDYGARTLYVHSLASGRVSWTESGATWVKYAQPSSSWTVDGCHGTDTDYEASLLGSDSVVGGESYPAPLSVNLDTSRIRGWFGASNTNYGLRIGSSSYMWIGSSNNANTTYRPKLTITYNLEPPDPAIYEGDTEQPPPPATGLMGGSMGEVVIGSVPSIPVSAKGNPFWQTKDSELSVLLLVTDGAYWRQRDAAGDPASHRAKAVRKRGYLIVQ